MKKILIIFLLLPLLVKGQTQKIDTITVRISDTRESKDNRIYPSLDDLVFTADYTEGISEQARQASKKLFTGYVRMVPVEKPMFMNNTVGYQRAWQGNVANGSKVGVWTSHIWKYLENTQHPSFMGVNITESAMVTGFGYKEDESPAKQAGIQIGDVITKMGDSLIESNSSVSGYLGKTRPGDKLNITINRNGKEILFSVTLGKQAGKVVTIKEDLKSGSTLFGNFLFGPNLGEENYINGKREGIATLLYDNGQKQIEGNYKDGKQEGLSTNWFENGQKKSEANYKDGKQEGLSTLWYLNGQKQMERNHKDGKQEGLWTEWYNNGQKFWEVNYKDQKRDGLYTDWYENGKKKSEGNYKDGKREGLWTSWHENGQKAYEGNNKDGEVITYIKWDQNGVKIKN